MATRMSRLASGTALGLMAGIGLFSLPALAQDSSDEVQDLGTVLLSAEEQVKQSLGVSTITSEDIAKTPVANDISEIVRKMPGVNLSGASATGQRGNQRQIDLRGMGPENTLILIDGKPVLSRNAVRMGRAGERDTRGDSNWVPAELIESIEVIRGPAAARYGSGAAGGVVNIVTKRPTEPTYSVGLRYGAPESGLEGADTRANFMIAQPMGEKLSFRLTGNYNKSEADDPSINAPADDTICNLGTDAKPIYEACPAAGMEGVINKDINALLAWEIDEQNQLDFEFGYGRQGNIFAGDRQLTSVNSTLNKLADAEAETNVMRRQTFALTHKGDYDFGSSDSYLQYENTRNTRNFEATAGGPEGSINSEDKGTIELENITAKSEWVLPTQVLGREASVTLGAELRYESMDDPVSIRQTVTNGTIPGTISDPKKRPTEMSQLLAGVYAEANIQWSDALTLTPALRVDHSDHFGFNLSPSLNASYLLSDAWTMKMGVGQAYKAPNLFQLNPNYVYYTRGNGCLASNPNLGAGCYVVGNEDLKAEKSLNTEIGFAYDAGQGVTGTITAFHNTYRDKIQSGMEVLGRFRNGTISSGVNAGQPAYAQYMQWENVPEAVVAGVEGSFAADLSETVRFSTNFTYMAKSENKQNGQPLSLVPKYTINAALNWDVTETVTLTPSLTHYGKIDAATLAPTTGDEAANTDARPAYTLVNLGVNWQMTEGAQLSAGVTNLFDKQILREGSAQSAGANTFNEPGRAFYVGLNATF